MPGGQPPSSVNLRRDLTELLVEISFEDLALTGEKILPSINVRETSAYYPVLPREAMGKVPVTERAPDGTYNRGQWEWSEETYTTREYGFEEPSDNVNALIWEDYIDQEETSATLAYQGLLLAREARIAAAVYNTTTFTGAGGTLAITHEWDDATNAVPWSDVDTGAGKIRAKSFIRKNQLSLVLNAKQFKVVMKTDEITGTVQYVEPIERMPEARKKEFLAEYLGIKEVVVVDSLYDSAGLSQDSTVTDFWSDEYMMLAYLTPGGSGWRTPGLGRQPVYAKYSSDFIIEEYDEPKINGKVFRAREYRGTVLDANFGFLFSNAITI